MVGSPRAYRQVPWSAARPSRLDTQHLDSAAHATQTTRRSLSCTLYSFKLANLLHLLPRVRISLVWVKFHARALIHLAWATGSRRPQHHQSRAYQAHQHDINKPSMRHQRRVNTASTKHQHFINTASTQGPLFVHACPLNAHEWSTAAASHSLTWRAWDRGHQGVAIPCVGTPRAAAAVDGRRQLVAGSGHQHGINTSSTKRQQRVYAASTQHQHRINPASTRRQRHINKTSTRQRRSTQLADAAPALRVSKRAASGLTRASSQVLMACEHRSQKRVAPSRGDAHWQQRPGSPPCHEWHPQAPTPVGKSL